MGIYHIMTVFEDFCDCFCCFVFCTVIAIEVCKLCLHVFCDGILAACSKRLHQLCTFFCITAKLQEMGVQVEEQDDTLLVRRSGKLRRTNVKTLPYPGFPTDMQPQITVALCLAEGTSMVTEGVWDNRYRYVGELTRMGAQIRVEGRSAVIEGVDHLTAASVQAYDLRAGAAMVIAALAAEGTSEVSNVHYIERGYEDIIGKLRNLGAQIDSVECDETVETRQIG